MHPDLEHLIQLQRFESDRDQARRGVDAMPARRETIDARLTEAQARVAQIHDRATAAQAARRTIEKDLALVQGRLAKFRDQLMAVKTNKEYQAMLHEIATADAEVKRFEDLLLERMMEADEIAAAIKLADADLAAERARARQEHEALAAEHAALEGALAEAERQRNALAASMPAGVVAMFDQLRARRDPAVVEARDGHCTVCHVRLRPQVYNQIRLNEELIRCDSCGRILYFVPPPAAPHPAPPPAPAEPA
jgi:hypothetical protein